MLKLCCWIGGFFFLFFAGFGLVLHIYMRLF